MARKKTVRDIDVAGKAVLVRVDYNVPFHLGTTDISDDSRIRASLDTVRLLSSHGARIVLCTHIGRPRGRVVESLRVAPVANRLTELLGQLVQTLSDDDGVTASEQISLMHPGDVALLENLRFHPEEESNDAAFAMKLASLANIYVDDAFGTAHRAHASTEGVTRYLPSVAGLLMDKELEMLGQALQEPAHPFVVVLGGAKVADKIGVIENLADRVDAFLIGGGMAAAFLKAQSHEIGASPVDDDELGHARNVQALAADGGFDVIAPTDVIVGDRFDSEAESSVVAASGVPAGWLVMDIGPDTAARFGERIREAGTVVWNGPMGVAEWDAFANGTKIVGQALADCAGTTILGGGSTAEAAYNLGLADRMTHVSTGGGASLEFLEGKDLPGVSALLDA